MRLGINSVGWSRLFLAMMALGVAFAEEVAGQVVKTDSSFSDTTQKPVWGYSSVISVSESVFVEIPKPAENRRKPEVLEKTCPICDSCYPVELGVGMCTAIYSRDSCVNSCGWRFQCRRTNEEFTIQLYECDRIKWGFWKKIKK